MNKTALGLSIFLALGFAAFGAWHFYFAPSMAEAKDVLELHERYDPITFSPNNGSGKLSQAQDPCGCYDKPEKDVACLKCIAAIEKSAQTMMTAALRADPKLCDDSGHKEGCLFRVKYNDVFYKAFSLKDPELCKDLPNTDDLSKGMRMKCMTNANYAKYVEQAMCAKVPDVAKCYQIPDLRLALTCVQDTKTVNERHEAMFAGKEAMCDSIPTESGREACKKRVQGFAEAVNSKDVAKCQSVALCGFLKEDCEKRIKEAR